MSSQITQYLSWAAAPSLAARTRGPSWVMTNLPCSVCGGRSAARSSRRTCRQSGRPARHRDRAPQPALVRMEYRSGRDRGPAAGDSSGLRWMAATLDGVVEGTGAVFEAKFMLPWSFSEEAAAGKHMAQLQHNMWVTASRSRPRCRSLPAAANGWSSPSMPIRSTSISC